MKPMAQPYDANEMMTIAAARALRNTRRLLRRHRHAVGSLQPRAHDACARHHADLRVRHDRHQARRAAALDRRRRVVRHRAHHRARCRKCSATGCRAGASRVGFLGGAQIDRFANLNTTVVGPYDKPKVRLPGGGGAPEIASRLRRDLHHHGQANAQLRRRSSISSPRSAMARAAIIARASGSRPKADQADHRPGGVRAGSRDQGDDGDVDPSRRDARADRRRIPAGRCAMPRSCRDAAADRRTSSRCCANCTRVPPGRMATAGLRREQDGCHMPEVFICDAVRTPIGRYGGALAKVRTDDLAAVPLKALISAQSEGRLVRARRGLFRLRQPGRRGQPQRRPHGAAARRHARQRAGRHRQPPVRLRPQCGRRGRARHPGGRDRFRHRGRRRVDDAGAVRHGQGDRGVPAQRRDRTTPRSAGASSIR